jgi:hypothetical protein
MACEAGQQRQTGWGTMDIAHKRSRVQVQNWVRQGLNPESENERRSKQRKGAHSSGAEGGGRHCPIHLSARMCGHLGCNGVEGGQCGRKAGAGTITVRVVGAQEWSIEGCKGIRGGLKGCIIPCLPA